MDDQTTIPPDDASKKAEPQPPVREIHHHHYGRRGGALGRFFFGFVIIFIGLAYLAQNMGLVAAVDWGELLARFWPVLVILFGLSLVSRGGWIGGIITALVTLLVLGFLSYFVVAGPVAGRDARVTDFSFARQTGAETSRVDVKFGAGTVAVRGGAGALVEGRLNSNVMDLESRSALSGAVQQTELSVDNAWRGGFGRRNTNELDVRLAPDVPVEVEVKSGASHLDLDFRETALTRLAVDAGASRLDLVLGDRAPKSDVAIKAGASSINIVLPKGAGARLEVAAGLSSKEFQDLPQVGEKTYESANYASAGKKINLTIDAGVSSIKVSWK